MRVVRDSAYLTALLSLRSFGEPPSSSSSNWKSSSAVWLPLPMELASFPWPPRFLLFLVFTSCHCPSSSSAVTCVDDWTSSLRSDPVVAELAEADGSLLGSLSDVEFAVAVPSVFSCVVLSSALAAAFSFCSSFLEVDASRGGDSVKVEWSRDTFSLGAGPSEGSGHCVGLIMGRT